MLRKPLIDKIILAIHFSPQLRLTQFLVRVAKSKLIMFGLCPDSQKMRLQISFRESFFFHAHCCQAGQQTVLSRCEGPICTAYRTEEDWLHTNMTFRKCENSPAFQSERRVQCRTQKTVHVTFIYTSSVGILLAETWRITASQCSSRKKALYARHEKQCLDSRQSSRNTHQPKWRKVVVVCACMCLQAYTQHTQSVPTQLHTYLAQHT